MRIEPLNEEKYPLFRLRVGFSFQENSQVNLLEGKQAKKKKILAQNRLFPKEKDHESFALWPGDPQTRSILKDLLH